MRSDSVGGAILVLLLLVLLLPAAAQARRLKVVELGGKPGAARASSIRVGDFSGDGVRTNGRILGFDPEEGDYSCSGTALATPTPSAQT